MSGLELAWQEVVTFTIVVAATSYLVVQTYRSVRQRRYGASCGACPANPANQARGDGARRCTVASSELGRAPPRP